MLKALFNAVNDLTSPEFRAVLWKSLGLTLGLFVALLVGVETLLSFLALVPWVWLQSIIALGAGLGLVVAFIFLMGPVTALFAGLFLDNIAAKVEARHYPNDPKGKPLAFGVALWVGLQFAGLALAVNLMVFPLVFFAGFGAVLLVAANAYLISREYFEMAAMRFVSPSQARGLYRQNTLKLFIAGLVPALISLVPIVNFVTPLFATSFFVHMFKKVSGSSA